MIKRIVMLICVMLFLMPVQAQDTETWFWAISNEGKLFAYTPAGQVNELAAAGVEDDEVFRISPSSALALLWVDEVYGLYVLTSDAITPVELPDVDFTLGKIYEVRGSLALLWTPTPSMVGDIVTNKLALVNFETGQSADLGQAVRPWIFTEEGVLYAKVEGDSEALTAVNVVRATVDETETLFELPLNTVFVQPDLTGDHWLAFQPDEAAGEVAFNLYALDGTSELLGSVVPGPEATVWSIAGNWLVQFVPGCTGECVFSRRPISGGETQDFTITKDDGFIDVDFMVDTTGDLVLWKSPDNILTMLREDGSVVTLGRYDFQTIGAETGRTSPGHRYILLVNIDPEQPAYQLWDLEAAQVVMEGTRGTQFTFMVVRYDENGVLVWDTETNVRRMYHDGAVTELTSDRNYSEILEDGSLLFWTGVGSEAPGIYLERGEEVTLLVPGARPLYARTFIG